MKSVLIADDHPDIVNMALDILDDGEVELFAAYDGIQAAELARREKPTLILADVMMAGLNGMELCRRIKADPTTANVIVVLMSAVYCSPAADCLADAFLRKPFDIVAMRATVARWLAASA